MTDKSEIDDKPPVRVKWEVPLPWLVSGAVFLAGQAGTQYMAVDRLTEKVAEQSVINKDLSKQISEMRTLIGTNSIKDTEHDLKLADHERRISVLEAKK